MKYDCIVIGAGAAGLFCAFQVAKGGKSVLLLEHNEQPGRKILISGGGRCNFINRKVGPSDFLCSDSDFPNYALESFGPEDFISLVERHRIPYYEKKLGQLFCRKSAKDILNMLLSECQQAKVELRVKMQDLKVERTESGFHVGNEKGSFETSHLVIATGGLSLPKIGASDFGHRLGKKMGHSLIQTRPALVGLKVPGFEGTSGVSTVAKVTSGDFSVSEDVLLTHRGLSGPAILKASLNWRPGSALEIDWIPGQDLAPLLEGKRKIYSVLKDLLPKSLSEELVKLAAFPNDRFLAEVGKKDKAKLCQIIHQFQVTPTGTEGMGKAEATAGGIKTEDVDPYTMESKIVPGLYFIGEVLDVTGQLGGYNFAWAWSSAWVAASAIRG